MRGPAAPVAPALAAAAWSRRVPGLGRFFARGLTLGPGAAGAAPGNARPRGAGGTCAGCSGLEQTRSRTWAICAWAHARNWGCQARMLGVRGPAEPVAPALAAAAWSRGGRDLGD